MNKQELKFKQKKMYTLIEQWEQSGLPKQLFCERHNLPYHVFYYYHNKYQGKPKKRKEKTRGAFLPVKITSAQAPFPPVEIIYPNGVSVKCPSAINPSQLKELINIF